VESHAQLPVPLCVLEKHKLRRAFVSNTLSNTITMAVLENTFVVPAWKKERKKTDKPREGWEDGTPPPPHRDFKERGVMR